MPRAAPPGIHNRQKRQETAMSEPLGLLLAMMQPSASMEEEFHDWYDTEHIPERAGVDGFLSAQRFVCVEGWPRYAALYDLRTHGVLKEPGYMALSGTKFSPWSKRILPRVHGQTRHEGPQVYPGNALYGGRGKPARLALLRFRGMAPEAEGAVIAALRRVFDGRPEILQLRVWRSDYHGDFAFVAGVEGDSTLTLAGLDLSGLGEHRRFLDLANVYTPYWRRGVLHGVFA
jgi:hypothetical protein